MAGIAMGGKNSLGKVLRVKERTGLQRTRPVSRTGTQKQGPYSPDNEGITPEEGGGTLSEKKSSSTLPPNYLISDKKEQNDPSKINHQTQGVASAGRKQNTP